MNGHDGHASVAAKEQLHLMMVPTKVSKLTSVISARVLREFGLQTGSRGGQILKDENDQIDVVETMNVIWCVAAAFQTLTKGQKGLSQGCFS